MIFGIAIDGRAVPADSESGQLVWKTAHGCCVAQLRGQNGRPPIAIEALWLWWAGRSQKKDVTMGDIAAQAKLASERISELLANNPSYVFSA